VKAKELAKILLDAQATGDEAQLSEAVKKVFLQCNSDMIALTEMRKPQTNEAHVSIIKEIDNKWQAMCRHAPGICNPMGFREVLKANHPLVYEIAFNNLIERQKEQAERIKDLRMNMLSLMFGR